MAVKIVEESAVLTLDFWGKEVIYNGQVFPVGTLVCDALNIPGEVVSHMEQQCEKLNSLEAFMKKYQCSEETADRYFREAKCLHSRKSLYITDEEGDDGREVMEEVADEEYSDMLEIFWNGIHANAVRKAFDWLTPE